MCTPLATHVELVSTLLTVGLHALVEKPFADNAADTRSLLALAADRRLIVCPVHQFLFQDGVRRIVDWLPALGRVRRIEFSTCSAGAVSGDPAAPDALVAEILPHPLSLIASLLGSRVFGADWQVTSRGYGLVWHDTGLVRLLPGVDNGPDFFKGPHDSDHGWNLDAVLPRVCAILQG